jgi:hypothetical protein
LQADIPGSNRNDSQTFSGGAGRIGIQNEVFHVNAGRAKPFRFVFLFVVPLTWKRLEKEVVPVMGGFRI